MNSQERKAHWEHIYATKALNEVSWYQAKPATSLAYFTENNIAKNAAIIDVGGGDSFLVDWLLEEGYTNLTVLDISAKAIQRVKNRLGDKASKVTWIVSDVLEFQPTQTYDVWHDRAAFHFLTDTKEVEYYKQLVSKASTKGGLLVIGTFSEKGPTKCSGISITQYTAAILTDLFQPVFSIQHTQTVYHITPFQTQQHFVFCSFLHTI